jgi:hypothetical protein
MLDEAMLTEDDDDLEFLCLMVGVQATSAVSLSMARLSRSSLPFWVDQNKYLGNKVFCDWSEFGGTPIPNR